MARMDSTRLPNKATMNVGGKKLIQWCIDGVVNTRLLEPIIVTTDRPVDDPLIEVAKQNKIKYFRGDTYNVAKRIYDCLIFFNVDIFVRITGDSPFVNRELIEQGLHILRHNPEIEFVTNIVSRRFPYGLSVEIFRSETYKKHFPKIISAEHQEHMTSWFYQNMDKVNSFTIEYLNGNDHDLRFVVDTPEDRDNIEKFIINNPSLNFYDAPIKELVEKYKNTIKSNK